MSDITHDSIGRIFCKEHRREICHECCMAFDMQNRIIEEEAGLVKKKTEVEKAAEEYALVVSALEGMERMRPRPSETVFKQHRKHLKDIEAKLHRFAKEGKDVESAKRAAMREKNNNDMQQRAILQAWSQQNPGKTTMEFGGPETQKIYESVAAPPPTKTSRADMFTCAYCKKVSTEKLMCCSRCKKISYCTKECQKQAWKAHKQECVPTEKIAKALPLTWEQVEAHGGRPVEGGTLEVRAMLDESMMRQVFSCKDRVGVIRRVAAYTNSRSLPGLKQGSIIKWKNPRFHYFMDGSSGARIEEEDMVNVTVTN